MCTLQLYIFVAGKLHRKRFSQLNSICLKSYSLLVSTYSGGFGHKIQFCHFLLHKISCILQGELYWHHMHAAKTRVHTVIEKRVPNLHNYGISK